MTEEIEKTMGDINVAEKLNSILSWVEETAKTAEAFAIEQTPLYIQELLAWNFWYSLIWFFVGIVLLLIGVNSLRILKRDMDKIVKEDDPLSFGVLAILSVLGLFFGPILFFNNFDWLKITVAPRVFLMEYVANNL